MAKEQSPIVTSLPAYVEQNRTELIAKSVLGAKSASIFNLQTGVKGSEAVNIQDTDVKFGDGKICGWNPDGTVTLSQRVIETGLVSVQIPFCDKKLIGTYAQHLVKIAAGAKTLPFEEDFSNGIVADTQAKLEKAIWQGDKASEDVNLNKFDGLIKIIDAADGVIDAQLAGGETKYEALKKIANKMPIEIRNAQDAVILVGADVFDDFIDEMVAANLYHYSADHVEGEYKLPAKNVKVMAVNGLNATNRVFAGRLSNFYFGCDMENDSEAFDLWYSKDNREFRLEIDFNAGVQIGIPSEVVKATLS